TLDFRLIIYPSPPIGATTPAAFLASPTGVKRLQLFRFEAILSSSEHEPRPESEFRGNLVAPDASVSYKPVSSLVLLKVTIRILHQITGTDARMPQPARSL
ncbi:MAG: hypothetical protein O3A38_01150, partial [Proteobacteria bacterium]|nr:hypothetical protein [Pseudomonadota bacterium]